jgi:predicted RNase H-like HicB family nuclease
MKKLEDIAYDIYLKRLPNSYVASTRKAYEGAVSEAYEAAKIFLEEFKRLKLIDAQGEDDDK